MLTAAHCCLSPVAGNSVLGLLHHNRRTDDQLNYPPTVFDGRSDKRPSRVGPASFIGHTELVAMVPGQVFWPKQYEDRVTGIRDNKWNVCIIKLKKPLNKNPFIPADICECLTPQLFHST